MTATPPLQIACPKCGASPQVVDTRVLCGRVGTVGRQDRGVWDFVVDGDYAESFGRQWSTFRHTQIDSKNGTTISRDQFARVTQWSKAELQDQNVLDAGCGAGRFSEIAASL